jgi:hypothetical protein
MTGAEVEMASLAQLERFCAEAEVIIAEAEDNYRRLIQTDACEGHRLMAAQVLAALRHLGRIVDRHRGQAATAAMPDTMIRSTLGKRPWWTGAWRIARVDLRRLDARS